MYRGFSATFMRDIAYGPYFCTYVFPFSLYKADADGRYEAMCRFFKSFKPPPPPPTASRNRHHDSLIDEAEAELASGLTWPELMAAGGVAGVTAWLVGPSLCIVDEGMTNEQVTFPFDAFKTRMQAESWTTDSDRSKSRTKPTLRQVIRYTIATQGWKACFAGLAPTLIR